MDRRKQALAAAKRGFEIEARFLELLQRDFGPIIYQDEGGYDFRTLDGRLVIELKLSLLSARDLYEALLRLVFVLAEQPEILEGVLVARFPRISRDRLGYEWERFTKPLLPAIAQRLGLVAIAVDGDLAIPEAAEGYRLLTIARETFRLEKSSLEAKRVSPRWSAKTFEVWKVLLEAWLRSEGLLSIHEIAERSGCSRPTVNAVFELLQGRKELVRGSNRSAGLSGLPRESLREMLMLSAHLRPSSRFIDASGRRPDPVGLVRRISERKPEGVAFGGVVAARHYQSDFDLNGLPRVDLTVHGDRSLDWLRFVDPTLQPLLSDENVPILVVHRLLRPAPRFAEDPQGVLPFADPAEVLLDLYELGLSEQAEEFVRLMRARGAEHV